MTKNIDKDLKKFSLQREHWKRIPFASDYYVSDLGRVYSVKRKKIKKLEKCGKYYRVSLRINGENVRYKMARLVGMVWVKGFLPELEIHHKNINSFDDRAKNLVWLTPSVHRLLHTMFKAYKKSLAAKMETRNEVVYGSNN